MKKIHLDKKKSWYHRKWQKGSGKLVAATVNGVRSINRESIELGYIEVPKSTLLVLYADPGPSEKIVFVHRPEKGLPLNRKFFADSIVKETKKMPRHVKGWISEFLWD